MGARWWRETFQYVKYDIAHNQTIIIIIINNIIIKTLNICSGKTHQNLSALKDLSMNQIKCIKQSTKINSWNRRTHSVSTAVFKIIEWRKQCEVDQSIFICTMWQKMPRDMKYNHMFALHQFISHNFMINTDISLWHVKSSQIRLCLSGRSPPQDGSSTASS